MLYDSVPISALISQGILVGGNGWDPNDIFGTQIIQGITLKQTKRVIVKGEKKGRGVIPLEEELNVVKLGGPFEEVGGKDEPVGGVD